MSQTTQNPLVDYDVISQASTYRQTQVTRLATATAQIATAQQNYDTAQAALKAAAQGTGGDPMVAALAIDDAVRARQVAAMVRDAAQQALQDADDKLRLAEGKAWRPVYLSGVRRRIAAAHAGDAARAALAAAEKEYAAASLVLEQAQNHGTVGVEGATLGSRPMTEADEVNFWASHRFDAVAGTFAPHWN